MEGRNFALPTATKTTQTTTHTLEYPKRAHTPLKRRIRHKIYIYIYSYTQDHRYSSIHATFDIAPQPYTGLAVTLCSPFPLPPHTLCAMLLAFSVYSLRLLLLPSRVVVVRLRFLLFVFVREKILSAPPS